MSKSLEALIWFLTVAFVVIVGGWLIDGILFGVHAKEWGEAQGKYLSADEANWYRTLKQPDHPYSSCCGAGDAYYADDSETDANGDLYAIITDGRPDTITLDDGNKAYRPHVPVGTKILVPRSKIRKTAVENPTDHTIIFLSQLGGYEEGADSGPAYGYGVYCYEPQAKF